jgi:hypothetical protein
MGLPPLSANVTNTVALMFTGVGSAMGSRPELAGQARTIVQFGIPALLGGSVGAALLLLTPSGTFQAIVPWLIGGASLLLLVQPYLTRFVRFAGAQSNRTEAESADIAEGAPAAPDVERAATRAAQPDSAPSVAGEALERGPARGWRGRLAAFGIFACTIYTGYFGAAGGILVFAVLTAALRGRTAQQANAMKNVMTAFANGVAAVGFALFGPVKWEFILPLAIGFLVGGRMGPVLARTLPGGVLRILAAVCGLGMAVKLSIH